MLGSYASTRTLKTLRLIANSGRGRSERLVAAADRTQLFGGSSSTRAGSGMAAKAAEASGPQLVPFDAQPQYSFGPWPIAASEVFARTHQSYAFVNLKPLVPGHVLVSPLRAAPRFSDLAPGEVADLMCLAQRVAASLERHYGATAVTLAIQDGAAAGQTVPHVHVHVLPRRSGDFPKNDQVYDDLEEQERDMAKDLERHTAPAQKLDLDIERKPRTREEMSEEAATLRALFPVE